MVGTGWLGAPGGCQGGEGCLVAGNLPCAAPTVHIQQAVLPVERPELGHLQLLALPSQAASGCLLSCRQVIVEVHLAVPKCPAATEELMLGLHAVELDKDRPGAAVRATSLLAQSENLPPGGLRQPDIPACASQGHRRRNAILFLQPVDDHVLRPLGDLRPLQLSLQCLDPVRDGRKLSCGPVTDFRHLPFQLAILVSQCIQLAGRLLKLLLHDSRYIRDLALLRNQGQCPRCRESLLIAWWWRAAPWCYSRGLSPQGPDHVAATAADAVAVAEGLQSRHRGSLLLRDCRKFGPYHGLTNLAASYPAPSGSGIY